MPTKPQPVAYSYIRFSTPEQAQGDSLRRQTEAAVDWCRRHQVPLDASTTLQDLGKSAYTGEHRKNPDRHALAAFLKLVEAGKIARGSYLIIENLDRLTREDERKALRLWLDILDQGINIVQLTPETVFRHEKSDMFDVMRAIMELSRGHGESARKSERNGAAWQAKLARARSSGEILTGQLPAWIEERDGKLCLIPERAAVVKRIFKMTASGYGLKSVVKRLTKEQVPPFGGRVPILDEQGQPVLHERGARKGKPKYRSQGGRYGGPVWVRTYVAKILKDRRALGEHQPRGAGRKPDGDPIPGFFPGVVTEDEWLAAQAGSLQRKTKPGRMGKQINVFAGLLRNARDGDTFFLSAVSRSKGGQRILVNTGGGNGRVTYQSFPFNVFERAVLSMLAEINPHDILNGDEGPDASLVLAGQMAAVEGRIAEMEGELLKGGEVAALARVLRRLEEQKRQLAEQLAEARQKAAHPLSEAWGEAQSLLAALDAAPDPEDARLRLRSALRRMIESIWLLVVPRGRDRLAAVQVWFSDGKRCRSYIILHRPTHGTRSGRREGRWWVRSFASMPGVNDMDLRQRGHAKRLERTLAAIDLDAVNNE